MGSHVGLRMWRLWSLMSFISFLFVLVSSYAPAEVENPRLPSVNSVTHSYNRYSTPERLSSIHARTSISEMSCNSEQRLILDSILREMDHWCLLAIRGSQIQWAADRREFGRYFASRRHSIEDLHQIVNDHYRSILSELERAGEGRARLTCDFPRQICRRQRKPVVVRPDLAYITVVIDVFFRLCGSVNVLT